MISTYTATIHTHTIMKSFYFQINCLFILLVVYFTVPLSLCLYLQLINVNVGENYLQIFYNFNVNHQ